MSQDTCPSSLSSATPVFSELELACPDCVVVARRRARARTGGNFLWGPIRGWRELARLALLLHRCTTPTAPTPRARMA